MSCLERSISVSSQQTPQCEQRMSLSKGSFSKLGFSMKRLFQSVKSIFRLSSSAHATFFNGTLSVALLP